MTCSYYDSKSKFCDFFKHYCNVKDQFECSMYVETTENPIDVIEKELFDEESCIMHDSLKKVNAKDKDNLNPCKGCKKYDEKNGCTIKSIIKKLKR